MKNINWFFVLPILVTLLQSCDDNQKAKNFNDKARIANEDALFIKLANEALLTEIKASSLAGYKAKNMRVVRFAKIIMNNYKQTETELAAFAKDKSLTIADTINPQHLKTIDSLSKLTAGFDKAYMQTLLNDHVATIKIFEGAATSKNDAIQQYANKILPVLKKHFDSAKAISVGLRN